jgi:hypothetical protein
MRGLIRGDAVMRGSIRGHAADARLDPRRRGDARLDPRPCGGERLVVVGRLREPARNDTVVVRLDASAPYGRRDCRVRRSPTRTRTA